ncbi:MAG: MFS transporter [bacterium]
MDLTHFKRNYILGIVNGVLFNLAFAFLSGATILPAFLSRLTSSGFLIGLASSLEDVGWLLPQYFVAGYIQPRKRKKTVYVVAAVFRSLTFGLLTLSIFVLANESPQLLWTFFLLFLLYSLAGGIAAVAFMDIVGKAIPPSKRGSFFGWRVSIGSGLGFLAALIVIRKILTDLSFPYNYGTIFAINFFVITLALTAFSLVKEPTYPTTERKKSLRAHLHRGLQILRQDANYLRFLIFRWFIGSFYLGLPFYVVYARRMLGVAEAAVAIFLSIYMFGVVTSNLLWGWLSNRVGNRIVLQLTSGAVMIAPIFVLSSALFHIPLVLYGAVFYFLGAIYSGLRVGYPNYLLDISPDQERPTYVGMLNTLIAPTLVFGGVGGLIVDLISFQFLYTIVLILSFPALFLSLKLKEPRTTARALNKTLTNMDMPT